jgi:hypothetical protein
MGEGSGSPATVVAGAGIESTGMGEAMDCLCLSCLAAFGAPGATIAAGPRSSTRFLGSSNAAFGRGVPWNVAIYPEVAHYAASAALAARVR